MSRTDHRQKAREHSRDRLLAQLRSDDAPVVPPIVGEQAAAAAAPVDRPADGFSRIPERQPITDVTPLFVRSARASRGQQRRLLQDEDKRRCLSRARSEACRRTSPAIRHASSSASSRCTTLLYVSSPSLGDVPGSSHQEPGHERPGVFRGHRTARARSRSATR